MKKKYIILIIFSSIYFYSCKKGPLKEIQKQHSTIEKKENSFVFGIDISHYNNNEIDILELRKDSIQFVICKATEGITYIDPKFNFNWKKIKEKGFIRGAYHFYKCQDNPLFQANFFINTLGKIQNNDIPPVVDFEEGGIDKSQSISTIQSNLLIFINQIEKKANVKHIIYTDINTANTYLNNPNFKKYLLWIANYNGKNKPDLPIIWKTKGYFIWQKTDTYSILNITDDADVFKGNINEFKDLIEDSYR